MMMKCHVFFIFLCLFLILVHGDSGIIVDEKFGFASSLQNNMVLQMQPHRAVIWGYGTVGAIVNVSLMQDVYSTKVIESSSKVGIWKVTLKSQPAGGPHDFQAVQDNHGLLSWILLKNVLFGDVWVCGGQSNMQFTIMMGFNGTEESALASNYPNIRVMTVAEEWSDVPLDDFKSILQPWSIASSESIGNSNIWSYFSAVCWLYGRYLYDELKIPIGLISSNWGGTPIEPWSSPLALEKCGLNSRREQNEKIGRNSMKPGSQQAKVKELKRSTARFQKEFTKFTSEQGPTDNSALWNAMIHPLLQMTIKGAIWYQGESNALLNNAKYSCSFPAMIDDWRDSWFEGTEGQTDKQFPFGFVQLSTVYLPQYTPFTSIRWHQTADYGYVPNSKMPNTFMAVAMDLGDTGSPYGSIHPRDKQDVAHRLVLGALNVAYGHNVAYQGPIPDSAVQSSDGQVLLTYPNDQNLLVIENSNFAVCCSFSTCDYLEVPSTNWVWAPILSSTSHSISLDVKVCSEFDGKAKMIRYAWALIPCKFKECSVYNDASLPAPPFAINVTDSS